MNPESLLQMLEPLRAPDAVSWWPPAPGWWLLAALLLLILWWALRRFWRSYRSAAPLRAARATLAQIAASSMTGAERAAALGQLQRRVALTLCGHSASAGLTGEAWATFLNGLARGEAPCFDATMAQLPYQPEIADDDAALLQSSTHDWLQRLEPSR
ncbi:MAG: hypothetical protein ACI87W_002287 [Halieaceae bacterium]|jgi:hypothetical protein